MFDFLSMFGKPLGKVDDTTEKAVKGLMDMGFVERKDGKDSAFPLEPNTMIKLTDKGRKYCVEELGMKDKTNESKNLFHLEDPPTDEELSDDK